MFLSAKGCSSAEPEVAEIVLTVYVISPVSAQAWKHVDIFVDSWTSHPWKMSSGVMLW